MNGKSTPTSAYRSLELGGVDEVTSGKWVEQYLEQLVPVELQTEHLPNTVSVPFASSYPAQPVAPFS
jgi:hypothetical protein